MARQKKIDLEHMTEKEKMKYEIAGELGLLERVLKKNKWYRNFCNILNSFDHRFFL